MIVILKYQLLKGSEVNRFLFIKKGKPNARLGCIEWELIVAIS